jgi:hypothetical protein
MKEYTIIKTHRRREREITDTLPKLIDYFSYTLLCGNSYNPKIPLEPKTIRALVSALNRSVKETQGGCYDRDYYELKI